jgi:hypothetical protein
MNEEKIMYDSPEAATRVDMPGWKSRLGHFYPGDNPSSEHGARWSGCTHMTCECGKIFDKGSIRCDSCQAKIDSEKYYALPMVEWDEVTPVCEDKNDKYFFDKESLMDEMYWQLEEAKKRGEEPVMHLLLCEPHYLHLLDGSEWEDDLPEEGELSDAAGKAIDALNAVLKAEGPSCWFPGKKRIDVDALWKELKEDLAKEEAEKSK